MNSSIKTLQILQSLVNQYGPPTEPNLSMYRGLMHDFFVDYPREFNLLKVTLEQGQVFRLIKEQEKIPYEILQQQIVSHLHNMFGMDEKASVWAVNAWAEALGIHLTHTCIADFSITPLQGDAPLSIHCINSSKGNITKYVWDFGDGERSSEKNPVHTYQKPGNYSITLKAMKDSFESIKISPDPVIVGYPELKGEISANITEGEIPLSIHFNSNYQGLVQSFDWNFGDGNHSTEKNPVHEYTTIGKFPVTLTLSDGNSAILIDFPEPIVVTPQKLQAEFSTSSPDAKNPLFIKFTNKSRGDPSRYLWDFGDGATSTDENPIHEYDSPGSYKVFLTITNEETGEQDISSQEVTTTLPPCEASFLPESKEGVHPLSVQFTNKSKGCIKNYEWDFGDGATSHDENPVHEYEKPGRYTVSLTVSDGVTHSKSLKKSAIIVRPSGFTAEFSCSNSSGTVPFIAQFYSRYSNPAATYHWLFGDGTESYEQNPSHEYKNAGMFSVTLQISYEGFSIEHKEKNLITVKPNPDIKNLELTPVYDSNEQAIQNQNGSHSTLKNSNNEKPLPQKASDDNSSSIITQYALMGVVILGVIIAVFIFSGGGYNSGSEHEKQSNIVNSKSTSSQSVSVTQTQKTVNNCHLGPSCDCENVILTGRDLSGYGLKNGNLRYGDLRRVDLEGATLTYGDLTGANLNGADLTDALMVRTNLNDADLRDTTIDNTFFGDADLSGANFEGASIVESDFSNANLRGASFKNAEVDDYTNFGGADLSGATWIYGDKCSEGSIGRCK